MMSFFATLFAGAAVLLAAVMFALLVLAPAGKTIGLYHAEHDACLMGARNGIEIKRCN